MKHLPFEKKYHKNEIACRFLHPLSENDCLIMTIPGGPGLSGTYLDPFLIALANAANINIGIMDLPNHGQSKITSKENSLFYMDCLEIIEKTICEIAQDCKYIMLFGQSFGARLAFDAFSVTTTKIHGLLLTGFPYKFDHSAELKNKMNSLDTPTSEKLFSLYTVVPFSSEQFLAISSEPEKNEHIKMLHGAPSIEFMSKLLTENKHHTPITIVEGDTDLVVPDENLQKFEEILPHVSCIKIPHAGHFVMIERPKETLDIFVPFILSIKKSLLNTTQENYQEQKN